MLKRIWDFYLSPKMGWVIYGSFIGILLPKGVAQGLGTVFWGLCMNLAAIRSLLLLFMKKRREVMQWHRGFWIGIGWLVLFLVLLLIFGADAFSLWTFPVLTWVDLESFGFIR